MARANVQTPIVLASNPHPDRSVLGSATKLFLRSIMAVMAAALCTAASLPAQNQQQNGGDESWTKTTDADSQGLNASRTSESHSKLGNRTVDKQKLELRGPNGGYRAYSETETETVQVDATTSRTVVRTYRWDANGQRILSGVSEQESRATAGGGVRTESKESTADVNGTLQVVSRQVADTKTVSPGVEETRTTVYKRDGYGGLSQAEQTQEVKTQTGEDSVAVKKTTLMPDGNGSWKLRDVTEQTVKTEGKDRITEERRSQPDLDGRVQERSRTVAKESENAAGEKTSTVENYSVVTPEYTGNGLELNHRVTTVQKKTSDGETTEQRIEQPGGNLSDGPKVSVRTKYVVKYAAPGSQQPAQETKTFENRDANGNFQVVSSENQKSTQAPTQTRPKQKSDAGTDKTEEKPPVKP